MMKKNKLFCITGGHDEYYKNFFNKTLIHVGYEVECINIPFNYDEKSIFLINKIEKNSIIICNNCDKKLLDYINNQQLITAYNALIYHEFNFATDRMSFVQIIISYRIWKAIKIFLVKIRNSLFGTRKMNYNILIANRDSLNSIANKLTWQKLQLFNNNNKINECKFQVLEYIYLIDSAEDSHTDLDRDEIRKESPSSYINKINLFINKLEELHGDKKLIFLVHPRRGNMSALDKICAIKSTYLNELGEGRLKIDNSIIYSGPSHLGLLLMKNGYLVKFVSLFKNNITHYQLENSNINFEK